MYVPYGNQNCPPGFFGNPNVPPELTQTMVNTGNLAANQAATTDLLIRIMQKLELKEDQLQVQKELAVFNKEEAFSSIEQTAQGLVTFGRTRQQHVVLPVHLDMVFHVQLDKLYRHESFYIVCFLNTEKPLILCQTEWNQPDLLLDALAAATGHPVKTYGTRKKTAQMLRSLLTSRARVFPVPFFAGWQKVSGKWDFSLLNGRTHGTDETPQAAIASLTESHSTIPERVPGPSSTMTMLGQILRLMDCVDDPELRSLLFTWIHAAALCSLLRQENFPIPMGLCLYCDDSRIANAMEVLMNWYHDKSISTSLPLDEFRRQITGRKDQPLTITDTASDKKTVDCLLTAMATGQIPAERGQVPQKLLALPTVVTSALGTLCYAPKFVRLEVDAGHISPVCLAQFSRLHQYLPDYLMAFSNYTLNHVNDLRREVENEIYAAHSDCPADAPISQDGLNTLGILSGIRKFVWQFHCHLVPDEELCARLHALSPRTHSALLMDALAKSAEYADTSTAIASRFCAIASHWISNGTLALYDTNGNPISKPACAPQGVVYRNFESHFFPTTTFRKICKATGISSPDILHALRDNGILEGKRILQGSHQTRKTIAGKNAAFYRLDSIAMDEFSKTE